MVEVAAGAHAVNQGEEEGVEVYYWREKNKEVDFVLKKGDKLVALEIKSGLVSRSHSGLRMFQNHWPDTRTWIIGEGGLSLDEFLRTGLEELFF